MLIRHPREVGGVQSSDEHQKWRLVERVTGRLDTFPTQIVHFAQAHALKAGACYALRARFVDATGSVGKTLYGEGMENIGSDITIKTKIARLPRRPVLRPPSGLRQPVLFALRVEPQRNNRSAGTVSFPFAYGGESG